MLNYIILVLLTAVLILSAVTVIAEPIFAGYKGVGRVLREIRIRLRAISRTSFCIWAGVIVIFALAVGDDEPLKVLAALLIMLLTLFILHPEDFLSIFFHRKKSKKLTPINETLCGKLPEAKIITETTKGQSQ